VGATLFFNGLHNRFVTRAFAAQMYQCVVAVHDCCNQVSDLLTGEPRKCTTESGG